jgi:NHL repeat
VAAGSDRVTAALRCVRQIPLDLADPAPIVLSYTHKENFMLRRPQPNVGWVAVLPLAFLAGCASDGQDGQVPTFEVNPFWPQPIEYPNIFGAVSGVTIAPDGNILIVSRYDQAAFGGSADLNVDRGVSSCCKYAPAVLEFAPDGSLVRQWGGPDQGSPWPASPRGIAVDPEGNVWIGGGPVAAAPGGGPEVYAGVAGAGGGETARPAAQFDGAVMKFSREGEHLATFGQEGTAARGNTSMAAFAGANDFAFDGDVAYVADGFGNNRVAIVDVATGEITGVLGAHGNTPNDEPLSPYQPGGASPDQFRSVTCVEFADDLIYVCDRGNNRVQVFDEDGTYVNEVVIAPATLGSGSVADIAFSPDERFMYVADGMNERVHIVDRESLTVLTSFGVGGRQPGEFRELGSIDVDEDGNIYTAEDGQGRRVQQFRYVGMGDVTAEHQGVLWPGNADE